MSAGTTRKRCQGEPASALSGDTRSVREKPDTRYLPPNAKVVPICRLVMGACAVRPAGTVRDRPRGISGDNSIIVKMSAYNGVRYPPAPVASGGPARPR